MNDFDDTLIPKNIIESFAAQALMAAGCREDDALITANGLCYTSLRGVDSHGVRLLPHYINALTGGRINKSPKMFFSKTNSSTGTFDADHGFGHVAGVKAMDCAIDLARTTGVGSVAVYNSSHCGSMSYFAERACAHDMIGIAFTHASPKVRSANSTECFFGINPICVTAPIGGEQPFCFDSAPTAFTSNKVKIYRDENCELPENVAADVDGKMTINPHVAEQLIPIGDYKGFGLASVVDIFCAMLTGMPFGPNVSMMYLDPIEEKRYLGQFYIAIRIDCFQEKDVFIERMRMMAEMLRAQNALDENHPPMVPGDPEKNYIKVRSKEGIPIPAYDLKRFNQIADELCIDRLGI